MKDQPSGRHFAAGGVSRRTLTPIEFQAQRATQPPTDQRKATEKARPPSAQAKLKMKFCGAPLVSPAGLAYWMAKSPVTYVTGKEMSPAGLNTGLRPKSYKGKEDVGARDAVGARPLLTRSRGGLGWINIT